MNLPRAAVGVPLGVVLALVIFGTLVALANLAYTRRRSRRLHERLRRMEGRLAAAGDVPDLTALLPPQPWVRDEDGHVFHAAAKCETCLDGVGHDGHPADYWIERCPIPMPPRWIPAGPDYWSTR